MANGTASFLDALARFDRPDRVDGLVAALGLEPCRVPLEPDRLRVLLPARLAQPAGAWTVAERDGLAVLLLVSERSVPVMALAGLGRRLAVCDPTRQYLLILCPASFETLTLAVAGLDGSTRQLTFERERPRATDLETLAEMVATGADGGVALLLRYARALDRSRVGARFFRDFRAQRERVAHAWLGLPESAVGERMALGLLFLCRLLFLYFLQRLGRLTGDTAYLPGLWRSRVRGGRVRETTFFRDVLQPLFFRSLNTRPADRGPDAMALGDLPYLNGGLFERTALERAAPALDLPDPVAGGVFENLFEKYRFTAVEPAASSAAAAAQSSGIDPAMLGHVFEGLMAPAERGRTGTFFTPPGIVDRLVQRTLEAFLEGREWTAPPSADGWQARPADDAERRLRVLRGIRVLDPACGSGAFLVGALARLASLRTALGEDAAQARTGIVAHALHGVDLQADAALLCALRLWLALTLPAGAGGDAVAPLPNLDRRVRQGDALLDPLELALPDGLPLPPAPRAALKREIAGIAPVARRYIDSDPGEREALQRELRERETRIARRWLEGWAAGAANERRSLEARALQRDLWGEPTSDARTASEALARLEERVRETDGMAVALRESGSLPFFSFPVHFPEAALSGFDVILMNPPWVRPHRWPAAVRSFARRRYAVCREPGWSSPALPGRGGAPGQVDLAMLFLERAAGLLAPGGALGTLLPAKALRSLYAGAARRLLLRSLRITRLEDFGLDQRAVFDADAFAMTVVATRRHAAEPPARRVRVAMHRPGREPLHFAVAEEDLPLVPGDPASPWLLAPPEARSAIRRMQQGGTALGRIVTGRLRRGIETGANEVLVIREAEPRLGGLAWVRAEGAFRSRRADTRTADFEAIIEDAALQPLVRGTDIRAWTFDVRRFLIRARDGSGRPLGSAPWLHRYLARHDAGARGSARAATREPARSAEPRFPVAWHDLARTLHAVALPPTVRTPFGERRPHLLNTVYHLDAGSEPEALRLAAFLNSRPVRTFAATIAERAKDAHFRFFAWTVSLLPLPDALREGPAARRLAEISAAAHADGRITETDQDELDAMVASAFGLSGRERSALARFEAWLLGRPGS